MIGFFLSRLFHDFTTPHALKIFAFLGHCQLHQGHGSWGPPSRLRKPLNGLDRSAAAKTRRCARQ